MAHSRPHVVIAGAGFAGFFTARGLEKKLPPGVADVTLVSATDHLCYSPLLPEVAAGRLEPRRIAVPLHASLHRTRIVQGVVSEVDLEGRGVTVIRPHDQEEHLDYDRLAITVGSVTRTFDTPGLMTYAKGMKNLAEAAYMRDHVLRQLQIADATDDLEERAARCTFVAVGAGYAGTESAAQLHLMCLQSLEQFPRLKRSDLHWILVDAAEKVLPELGDKLGDKALKMVRARGMDVRLGVTLEDIRADGVTTSEGDEIPTYTVMWCAGVAAAPLVGELGLPTTKGRLDVDAAMRVPGHEGVFAAGDAAAVPDLSKDPGEDGEHPVCPPTAQHAQRQGNRLAKNIAASLGHGEVQDYVHHDLGLVADMGNTASVAKPLGLELTGALAKVITKSYHLFALPSMASRVRVAADWGVGWVSHPPVTQTGFVDREQASLMQAELRGVS